MSISANWDEINLVSLIEAYNDFFSKNKETLGFQMDRMELRPTLSRLLDGVIKEELFGRLYGVDYYEIYDKEKEKSRKSLTDGFKKLCHNDCEPTALTMRLFTPEVIDIQKNKIELCKRKLRVANKRVDNNLLTNREVLGKNVGALYETYFDDGLREDLIIEFFGRLREQCMEPHFTRTELEDVNEKLKKKEYASFWYVLWLHAFQCSYYNLPYMYSNRAYQEAFTLKRNNLMYKSLLHAAVTQKEGVKNKKKQSSIEAAFEYGMQIFGEDFEEGLKYFNEALYKPGDKKLSLSRAACWVFAFQYENLLTKAEPERVDTLLDNVEKSSKYLEIKKKNDMQKGVFATLVPMTNGKNEERCLKVALDIYVYLCTSLEFSKAFNSIGKLLLLGKIRLQEEKNINGDINNCPLSRQLALDCLNRAMVLGNGNAMVNWSRYYRKCLPSDGRVAKNAIEQEALDNRPEVRRRLKVMADLNEVIACEYYGDILKEEGAVEEAITYYEKAVKNNCPAVALKLGELYEQKGEKNKAYEYYKIAAKAKVPGAEEFIKNCDPKCILHMGIKKQEKVLIELKDELSMINGSEKEVARILHIIEELKKVCDGD